MSLLETADNSFTWVSEIHGVPFHSRRGALSESHHVFLESGWIPAFNLYQTEIASSEASPFFAFEMGFGTGLNAALVAQWMDVHAPNTHWNYVSLDAHPLSATDSATFWEAFSRSHPQGASLREALDRALRDGRVHIVTESLQTWMVDRAQTDPIRYRLFLYDAFAPASQPELWTTAVWDSLHALAAPRALWVSYCAKASVHRSLIQSSWHPQRWPGPPGKREMLRAWTPGPGRRWVERVYGLLEWKGAVLVAHERFRSRPLIKFPGGGMEHGESQAEALKREFDEELQAEVAVCERRWSSPHPVASAFDGAVDVVVHYYRVALPDARCASLPVVPWGTPLPEGHEDVQQFSWVPLDAVHQLPFTFPADQTVAAACEIYLKKGVKPVGD
jgi:tRNA U34 5-methylaminomethyl-2-thiouridine-forming methyltransferase MnmC/ADP-ribose pyrophosphatase YjhB (NUDIX family)